MAFSRRITTLPSHCPQIAAPPDGIVVHYLTASHTLSEWKASESSSLLWVHAKRQFVYTFRTLLQKLMIVAFVAELGKSVLWYANPSIFLSGEFKVTTSIIEDIDTMRRSGLPSLAMFYCNFREEQKKGVVACSHPR